MEQHEHATDIIPFPSDRVGNAQDAPERAGEAQASPQTLHNLVDEMNTLIKAPEDGVSEGATRHNRNRSIMVGYNPVTEALEYRIVTRQFDEQDRLRFTEQLDAVTIQRNAQTGNFETTFSSSFVPGRLARVQKIGAPLGTKEWVEQVDVSAQKNLVEPVLTEEVCKNHMAIARAEVELRAQEKRAAMGLVQESKTAEK